MTGLQTPGWEHAKALVGRERERGRLLEVLDESLHGHGRFVLLSGAEGIGKTRLAEEIAHLAEVRRASVYVARCSRRSSCAAFEPWVRIIECCVLADDAETVRRHMGVGAMDIAQMVAAVRVRLPDLPAAQPIESEFARFRIFDEITTFFANVGRERPLVVVLDDLDCADEGSLRLLRFLATRLSAARVLVIGTARASALCAGQVLAGMVADLRKDAACEVIPLRGLSETETRDFLGAVGGRAVIGSLSALLGRATAGNPLFLREALAHMLEEGMISAEGDCWVMPAGRDAPRIAGGVRQLIRERLARLGTPCRELLTCAAVMGQESAVDVLRMVAGVAEDRVVVLLNEAGSAGVVEGVQTGSAVVRFTHELYPEVLYEDLPVPQRAALHRRTGMVLEKCYADDPAAHLAEIAHHFFQARTASEGDDGEKTAAYALRAGKGAAARFAYEEAVAHYERGLRVLSRARSLTESEKGRQEGCRCDLLLALGDACWKLGEAERAREACAESACVARRIGDPERFAHAALGFGGVFRWSEITAGDTLVRLLEEALAGLPEAKTPLRANVLARLGFALYLAPRLEAGEGNRRRRELSNQALAIALDLGNEGTLAPVLYHRHYALWEPDNVRERLEIAERLARAARASGARELVVEACGLRVVDLLEVGDSAGLEAELARYATLAGELRQPWYQYISGVFTATCTLMRGDLAASERRIGEVFELGRPLDEDLAARVFGGQNMVRAVMEGRIGEYAGAITALVDQYPEMPLYRCLLVCAYAHEGRVDEARTILPALAADRFAILPQDSNWLAAVSFLSPVILDHGLTEVAALLYEMMSPCAERSVLVSYAIGYLGCSSRYLGLLATALGRWDDAVEHFEQAIAWEIRLRARPWLALAQCDYARMLLARGDRGDRDSAAGLLAHAAETVRSLGLSHLAARAGALLDQAGRG